MRAGPATKQRQGRLTGPLSSRPMTVVPPQHRIFNNLKGRASENQGPHTITRKGSVLSGEAYRCQRLKGRKIGGGFKGSKAGLKNGEEWERVNKVKLSQPGSCYGGHKCVATPSHLNLERSELDPGGKKHWVGSGGTTSKKNSSVCQRGGGSYGRSLFTTRPGVHENTKTGGESR